MDVYQRRRLVALSVVAALFIFIVLLIRSCGGDEESTPVTPVAGTTGVGGATTLSLDDYIATADQSCLETNTALASVDESDPQAAAAESGQILAGELETLQSLTLAPDAEGQDKLDKFLSAVLEQANNYNDLATAVERGDDTATAELQAAIDEAAAEAERLGRRFGFEICGNLSEVGESSDGSGSADGDAAAADPDAADTGAVAPAPTTTTPVAPAPTTTTPVAPAPAPTDDGGTSPVTPAPAPTDDGSSSGSGGVTP